MKKNNFRSMLFISSILVFFASQTVYSNETDFTFTVASGGVTITGYKGNSKDINIPSTINNLPVIRIQTDSFREMQLTSVTIPNSVTHIGASAFLRNLLTSITIPNSVTSIATSAFANNRLTSVTIPNSVTSIGSGAFRENQLTSVIIPNSIDKIEGTVFSYNRLTSVTIPNNVTSIGSGAFRENQLTSITFPNSITNIENNAFRSNKLTNVTFPNSVTYIGSDAFGDNLITSVMVPDDARIAVTAFGNAEVRKPGRILIPGSNTQQTPISIIGTWKLVSGNQTTVLTYYDDNTYTVEVNSTPREVGTYSFTNTQIMNTPTHIYNTSTRKLVDAPRRTTVNINYTISGNKLTLQGRGTFTLVE